MQVKELIEQLQDMNPEAEVHFAYGYGDHWRTTVAPSASRVSQGLVQYSEYHRMDKIVENDDIDFDEETGEEIVNETLRRVVIID
jgi:hypothetical protein